MKSVWKFTLDISDTQTISMPEGAQIIEFAEQYGRPCLWAIVEPDAVRVDRHFMMAGTGHPIPDDPGAPIGSIVTMGGALVWHLFEVPA